MKIIVKDLEHSFNPKTPIEVKALSSSGAVLEQGEYVAIIGHTGSGKTTFIEHLNSLLLPSHGTINWVFDHEYYDRKSKSYLTSHKNIQIRPKFWKRFRQSKLIRSYVGIVFQFAEYQLFETTIEKDIMFGPISFGVPKEEAKALAAKYLEVVGLSSAYLKRNPLDLSGGQKRRVALAGILAIEPDFLIFDEPTAGLDPAGVKEILDIFDVINKKGSTIIMVTHDMNNVYQRTERTIVFNRGKIIRDDTTAHILNDLPFLKRNQLVPPKIVDLIAKIQERKNIHFPILKSEEELANYLNKLIASKKEREENA